MPRIHFCADESCPEHQYAWTVDDAAPYDRQWHDKGMQRVKVGRDWYCERHGVAHEPKTRNPVRLASR